MNKNVFVVLYYGAKISQSDPNLLLPTNLEIYGNAYFSLEEACKESIRFTKLNRLAYKENNNCMLYIPRVLGVYNKIELKEECDCWQDVDFNEKELKEMVELPNEYKEVSLLDFGIKNKE